MQYRLKACQYCNTVWVEPNMVRISMRRPEIGWVSEDTSFDWDICKGCNEVLKVQQAEYEQGMRDQEALGIPNPPKGE